MIVYNHLSHLITKQPTCVTIGNFDGVHLGHRRLIRAAVSAARTAGQRSVLVTFFPHPRSVSGKDPNLKYLTTHQDKLKQFQNLGIDIAVAVEFTPDIMQLCAAQFVDLLCRHLGMRDLWVGHDFSLGYQREGTQTELQHMGKKRGYTFHCIDPVLLDQQLISSTRIRGALQHGNLSEVNACLGRPFRLEGMVLDSQIIGKERKRRIAALYVNAQLAIPAKGHYICDTEISGTHCLGIVSFDEQSASCSQGSIVQIIVPNRHIDLFGHLVQIDILNPIPNAKYFIL